MVEKQMNEYHDHNHDHDRTFQPDLEDFPPSESELMAEAIRTLLIEKGIFEAEEVRSEVDKVDSVESTLGARIVARAWCDQKFKETLLVDATKAVKIFNVDMGEAVLIAVENTSNHHNLIVCTLCSCYPRQVLGLPPDWYKSRAYRSRAVIEPRAVLEEFGTQIDDGVELRVHDSTADIRYMVLPKRPSGAEDYSEEQLAKLVTRDMLVGVTVPKI